MASEQVVFVTYEETFDHYPILSIRSIYRTLENAVVSTLAHMEKDYRNSFENWHNMGIYQVSLNEWSDEWDNSEKKIKDYRILDDGVFQSDPWEVKIIDQTTNETVHTFNVNAYWESKRTLSP